MTNPTITYDNGTRIEEWKEDGLLHREDGPAYSADNINNHINEGKWSKEKWYIRGKLHRDDGPAWTERLGNGDLSSEFWACQGKYHRIDGPAKIFYKKGIPHYEYWILDGKHHRDNGPAMIEYGRDGKSIRDEWYQFGHHHRTVGPAIEYFSSFDYYRNKWIHNGEHITHRIIRLCKSLNFPKEKIENPWSTWTDDERILVHLSLSDDD